jgi:DNA (cytosine-5)-methyltransferase 1
MSSFAKVRVEAGFSLQEIASDFGVPVSQVQHWDRGELPAPAYILSSLDLIGRFDPRSALDRVTCSEAQHPDLTRYPPPCDDSIDSAVDHSVRSGKECTRMKAQFTLGEAFANDRPCSAVGSAPLEVTEANPKRKLRLLDLFCCAGGAAVGYNRAGFEIVGVDIVARPSFPFAFIQADVMKLDPEFIASFDAIHASPPCQSYSDLAKRNGNGDDWPRLVEPVREMLVASGRPYIIENVEGAPLLNPLVLCGTMFPGLRVIRHRLFEMNFVVTAPPHKKHPKVHTFDKRKSHFGKTNEWTDFVQVTGGGNCRLAAARDAMGIDWMSKGEINEAIPPAYTELIGRQLLAQLQAEPVDSEKVLQAA